MDEIELLLRELEQWDAESPFEHSGQIDPIERLRWLRDNYDGELSILEAKVKAQGDEIKRQGKELTTLRKWKRKLARLIGAHANEIFNS
jgi:hypothetical protein